MKTCEKEVHAIGFTVTAIAAAIIALTQTGCMAALGIKSYESGTNADGSEWSKWAFTQGLDLGVSANAIDTVSNQRGIQPEDVTSSTRKGGRNGR